MTITYDPVTGLSNDIEETPPTREAGVTKPAVSESSMRGFTPEGKNSTFITSLEQLEDKDARWLRQSFMMPRSIANMADQRKALFGDVRFKFTDTTLGGNFAINPPPQFTRYADVRVEGSRGNRDYNPSADSYFEGADAGQGLGPYYSESIDDHSQLIHLRFGVPEFNDLWAFLTGFYNGKAALLARTGRLDPSLAYKAGRALGFIATIPFAPLILGFSTYRFLANTPASKYYYLKNAMPLYWNSVSTIVNSLAVNMSLIPPIWGEEQKKVAAEAAKDGMHEIEMPTKADQQAMNKLFSDFDDNIWYADGGIDILAVATKATRKAISHQKKLREILKDFGDEQDLAKKLNAYLDEKVIAEPVNTNGGESMVDAAMRRWATSSMGSTAEAGIVDGKEDAAGEKTNRGLWDRAKDGYNLLKGKASKAGEYFEAEAADGSDFVTFRVSYQPTVSESFSSSTKESGIASKINSSSMAARDVRFNFAEGNFGSGIFDIAEAMVGGVKDFVAGGLDSIGASGLAAMAGSALVDVPQYWEQSTANLPTNNYTIQLRSPYGNKLSIYQNIMVPLAMLLAGALPLSAGRHAYTSPFLCELYSKGRSCVRLGIIDSLSITRGAGNLGWSLDGLPLGVDINFSVKDLSSIMHMAIEPTFSLNPAAGVLDEDNSFNDYMATLGGLGLADMVYTFDHKLKLNLTRKAVSFRKWTSISKWANVANYTRPGRLWNAIAREVERE